MQADRVPSDIAQAELQALQIRGWGDAVSAAVRVAEEAKHDSPASAARAVLDAVDAALGEIRKRESERDPPRA